MDLLASFADVRLHSGSLGYLQGSGVEDNSEGLDISALKAIGPDFRWYRVSEVIQASEEAFKVSHWKELPSATDDQDDPGRLARGKMGLSKELDKYQLVAVQPKAHCWMQNSSTKSLSCGLALKVLGAFSLNT